MNFRKTIGGANVGDLLTFLGLTIVTLGVSFIIAKFGVMLGIVAIIALCSLPVLALLLTNVRFGFFTILSLSFFINYINRWTDQIVPLMTLEIVLYIVLIGLIMKEAQGPKLKEILGKYFANPVAIALIIWIAYNHIQILNPGSSYIIGKLIAIRQSWYTLFGYFIALYVFDNMNQVKFFFRVIIVISLAAALFGMSQKWIGLFPYERTWLYASPERVRLFINTGQLRAWSFLNDPSNFGLLMAASALTCFILATGPYKIKNRILLSLLGVVMILGMMTSGTRTAFVALLAGFAFFGLVNIKNIRVLIISMIALMAFVVAYFGPFYSAPFIRFRSAFQGSKDPSMNVRLINKDRIRPYLFSHPIGGGPNTTGGTKELSHPLAGFPPDSGSLRIALEYGYIGLLLSMWLYYRTSSRLVSEYFQSKVPEKRNLYMAMLIPMIALCTAELTQITISQKPFDFYFFCYYALAVKLRDI